MQLTKTSTMASKRTFVWWIVLVRTGLFCNGRIWARRGVILIVRVLKWGNTISVVVGLDLTLIIGTRSRVGICRIV